MIRECLRQSFGSTLWVRAQISELRANANGHCYMELVEKDEKNTIIARQKATIWANTFVMLRAYFEQTTQISLQAGLEVLVGCSVEMHESYGMSLNITDINPEYTIGKIAMDKSQIIARLEEDGVIDLNASLPFPRLPQRVAVISSKTAAGYEDFIHQIEGNSRGYRFTVELFEARMQGEATEASVIEALDSIFEQVDRFDLVVIIRGGGATADLSAFDNYNIAFRVAQFPLPVVCGIGHQRDSTVLDIVAHTSVKTPTATAELLIKAFGKQEDYIAEIAQSFKKIIKQNIEINRKIVNNLAFNISHVPKAVFAREEQKLSQSLIAVENRTKEMLRGRQQNINYMHNIFKTKTKYAISQQANWLMIKEKTVALLSPKSVLKRGYAIVQQGDKIVKSAQSLDQDREFEILFHDGVAKVERSNCFLQKKNNPM